MSDGLRITPIRRSLHRPQMILGGERELMLFSMLVTGLLTILTMNVFAITVGVIFWTICAFGLRKMGKADPQMSKVYMRQFSLQSYYPAFSKPWRQSISRRIY